MSRALLALLLTLGLWMVLALCYLVCFGAMWWKPLLHIWETWKDEHIIVQGMLFVAVVVCATYLVVYTAVSLVFRLKA